MEWAIGGVTLVLIAAMGWWFARYVRSVYRGDYRHPKDRKQTWWIAGGGTHGGAGGQVPPLLPDPDPEDEIR
jgi:hypothetical protein